MLAIKEWKWEKVKTKERSESTLSCPYCNVKVRASSDTRIVDVDTGAIKYQIFKCPECYMPIIIGLDGEIIPQSQLLPFGDVDHLPESIAKMYHECRKCFANDCFHSVMMMSRTMIMHIASNLGGKSNKNFVYYVNYLESEGYIARHARVWVDKIRTLGNRYVHELDAVTKEDAELVLKFIMYLLIYVYQLPNEAGGAAHVD